MHRSEYARLVAFAAIVANGSFARAAAHLGVTPSALSQSIRQLEDRLGVRLLHRTTRSVAPSAAGTRLLARIAPALAELDGAVADVTRGRDVPAGVLRITASRSTAELTLPGPVLARFAARCPEVVLDLVLDDRLIDIVGARFDAGIRLAERVARDMVAVPIGGPLRLLPVATPGYFARHGRPRHPRDLRAHRCIGIRMPRGELYRWEFERDGKALDIAVQGPVISNDNDTGCRAALAGLGIAFVFDVVAAPYLARGELEAVLEEWCPAFPGFQLYYPSRRQISPALRAFIDVLTAGTVTTARRR